MLASNCRSNSACLFYLFIFCSELLLSEFL